MEAADDGLEHRLRRLLPGDHPGASWNKADFPGSCVRFGDSVRLPQADQVAFGPRKGLNLPAASNSIAFFLSARGPPTNLKEGVS